VLLLVVGEVGEDEGEDVRGFVVDYGGRIGAREGVWIGGRHDGCED
jgi:hypothetical protein